MKNITSTLGKTNLHKTSKYYGVCFFKQKDKWKSSIYVNEKYVYLGIWETEEQAAEAFNVGFGVFETEFFTIRNNTKLSIEMKMMIERKVLSRLASVGLISTL